MKTVEKGKYMHATDWGDVDYRILVDRETNVMYYAEYYKGLYSGAGTSITPLYNPDGTLKIYNGD